jgi:hypothetical protein
MSAYKTDQRRLVHDGREYHFVSYDGVTPKPNDPRPATAPTWFLIAGGKRWPVMPQVIGQPVAELDEQLRRWLESNMTAHTPVPAIVAPRRGVR